MMPGGGGGWLLSCVGLVEFSVGLVELTAVVFVMVEFRAAEMSVLFGFELLLEGGDAGVAPPASMRRVLPRATASCGSRRQSACRWTGGEAGRPAWLPARAARCARVRAAHASQLGLGLVRSTWTCMGKGARRVAWWAHHYRVCTG